MKNLRIAILLLLTISSCLPDKIGKKDPEPDLSGSYQVTEVSNATGVTYRPPAVSGTTNVTKVDDNNVDLAIAITGTITLRASGRINLRKASGKTYDMYEDNSRLGTIDGTEIRFDVSTSNGRVILVARK